MGKETNERITGWWMGKETNERQSLHGPAGPRGGGGGVAMHSHFTQIKSG